MATILIVDDNESVRDGLGHVIRKMGHSVVTAPSGKEGLELFRIHQPDFAITDLKMDGMDGVAVLQKIRELDADCPTMIITAHGSVETAVEAMKLGAFDFLVKPFTPEVVRLKVGSALELRRSRQSERRLEEENAYLRTEAAARFGEIVGGTESMQRIFKVIERVAPTDASVAIYGESGTGKELIARAIHQRSKRKDGPFIKVNCGALAETLLESELFGHEKGSFTGAIKRKLGRFELADKGTIFLDEIGDISPAMQTKLLRVLQEREIDRVGGEQPVKVDVRVVSATHRNLAEEVRAGRFREDLFYRMQVVPVQLPALRERLEDLPLLVQHFITTLGPRTNAKVKSIDQAALERLAAHRWPGNIRELGNVIEQALVFTDGDKIVPEALPEALRSGDRVAATGLDGASATTGDGTLPLPSGDRPLPDILDDLERQLIVRAYQQAKGVKTETARLLGIKTSALYYKLEKYGIT